MDNIVYAVTKVFVDTEEEIIMKLCVTEKHAYDVIDDMPLSERLEYRIKEIEIQ